jgi:hypothetical protein
MKLERRNLDSHEVQRIATNIRAAECNKLGSRSSTKKTIVFIEDEIERSTGAPRAGVCQQRSD